MKKFIIPAVALIALTACDNTPDYDASGFFEATEVTLSAESAGKIMILDVEEGDTLAANQLIALIDTVPLHLERLQLEGQRDVTAVQRPDVATQLAATRQELSKQQTEKRRIENLLAAGAATTKQLDDINSAIKVLEDRLKAQESTLSKSASQADRAVDVIDAQIARLNDRIARCSVLSPISGTVVTKFCEAGEYAAPGKPIVKVADLKKMKLTAYFTSEQLADLKIGQEVTVLANYGGDSVKEYTGHITSIASESEFTPKNIQTQDSRSNLVYAVKIAVDNSDGKLKIGSFGNVRL